MKSYVVHSVLERKAADFNYRVWTIYARQAAAVFERLARNAADSIGGTTISYSCGYDHGTRIFIVLRCSLIGDEYHIAVEVIVIINAVDLEGESGGGQ